MLPGAGGLDPSENPITAAGKTTKGMAKAAHGIESALRGRYDEQNEEEMPAGKDRGLGETCGWLRGAGAVRAGAGAGSVQMRVL